jgi:methyl-accepting chemotaxis protein
MTPPNSYSLQRTMIIYILLIGFAALLVSSEFVMDTHSTALKQELTQIFNDMQQRGTGRGPSLRALGENPQQSHDDGGVILAVVVIVLTMFIKTITEPLQHMVEVSKAISAGDLSRTTGVDSKNELSQLSAAIDDMSTNLQEIIMLSRSVCDSAGRVTPIPWG